jgi:hypothetical protein
MIYQINPNPIVKQHQPVWPVAIAHRTCAISESIHPIETCTHHHRSSVLVVVVLYQFDAVVVQHSLVHYRMTVFIYIIITKHHIL